MSTLVLLILVIILVGLVPGWPHTTDWGPYPAGGLGLVVIVLLILLLVGRI